MLTGQKPDPPAMPRLSLALFEAGILFVDHIQASFPSHDLAIGATFFNGGSYFHISLFYTFKTNTGTLYLYLKMILPLDRSYGLISTPTLSPGRIRM